MKSKKIRIRLHNCVFFLILPTIFVALWFIYFYSVYYFFPEEPWEDIWAKRAQFGDLFGGFNALFSALAFSAVLYTIYLQRRDLEAQRANLDLNYQEAKRAADAHEARITQEENLFKQTLALRLYDAWHTKELQESYGNCLSYFSAFKQHDFDSFSLSLIREEDPETLEDLIKLLSFIKKWLILSNSGQIDSELFKVLMSIDSKEMNDKILSVLCKTSETDPDFSNLIEYISEQFPKFTLP